MTMNPFRLLPVLLFVSVFLLSCQPKSKDIASPAPSELVVYEAFDDFAPLLENKSDTAYVINFWATWCAPCVEEMPYFETLHERMSGEKVKVFLVSLDFKKDLETKLKPFLEEKKLKPTVMMLADGRYNDWIDRVTPEWSGAIPATVVVKGGELRFFGEQFPSYEALENWVKGL